MINSLFRIPASTDGKRVTARLSTLMRVAGTIVVLRSQTSRDAPAHPNLCQQLCEIPVAVVLHIGYLTLIHCDI